ncbi:hypothetical protein BDY17DRAFT_313575 [Neohortaea acidophila]|uniref:DUF1772-domain-containing protein n=1 Tax=Neohortaea acidophila TaxID=245834 RepID=A0A6A6PGQ9_9PEZI|nr:uncharacterized protein BDY17DRAFT_313575 [Neohortaea acidophila]KAF2478966.1 hypothetical protein BDY17DRAFT_313575 [Neohortaea acidophila]
MAIVPRDTTTILGIKAAVTGSTLLIAGGMANTSLSFIPNLIKAAQTMPSTRPSMSRLESGRLTPHPDGGNISAAHAAANEGYQMPAKQFVNMSKTAFATQVPPELLSIAASGYLAYHYRQLGASFAGYKWTAVAVLIASIFPFTGALMVPIDHKIAQIGGVEEKPEPYEDAPLDRHAERRNAVEFLRKWNSLNTLRSAIMFVAGGIGLWSLVEE